MALRQYDWLSLIGNGPIKSSPPNEKKFLLVSTGIIHDVLFQKYWIVDIPDNAESHLVPGTNKFMIWIILNL